MRKLLLLVYFVIYSLTLRGQMLEDKLRLIAGFPDYNFASETSDLVNVSAILKVEQDSLVEETLITDSLQRLDFLRCYPEYNKVIAMTKRKRSIYEVVPSLNYQMIIVDTKTLEKNTVTIPDSVFNNGIYYKYYSHSFSSIIKKGELKLILKYVNFSLSKSDTTSVRKNYYLFNPETHFLEKTEPSIYKQAIANSGNMVLINNYEGEILKGDTTTNVLRIATSKFYGNPIYCDYLPPDVKISKKTYAYAAATVLINNDNILALYLYEREQRGRWIFCKVHVYDKQKEKWGIFELETSWVLAKYYSDYIAGNYRVKQLKGKDENFPFDEQYWDKEKTKYGPSYKYFFIDYPVRRYYSEGDLYLYNWKNGNMMKWNTGHGDCEVLLVEDEIVYYRVDDKIYKMPIVEGRELGDPRLIIQDKRISDVHWAFIQGN